MATQVNDGLSALLKKSENDIGARLASLNRFAYDREDNAGTSYRRIASGRRAAGPWMVRIIQSQPPANRKEKPLTESLLLEFGEPRDGQLDVLLVIEKTQSDEMRESFLIPRLTPLSLIALLEKFLDKNMPLHNMVALLGHLKQAAG